MKLIVLICIICVFMSGCRYEKDISKPYDKPLEYIKNSESVIKNNENGITLSQMDLLSGFEQAADEIDVTFESSELILNEIAYFEEGIFVDIYSENISEMGYTYHELVYIKDDDIEKLYSGFIHGVITTAYVDETEFVVVVPEIWITPADIAAVTECKAYTVLSGRPVEVLCGERQLYAYLKKPVQLMALKDDGEDLWCHKDIEKINSGEYSQQLSFKDGILTVIDENTLVFNLNDADGISAYIENEIPWIDENLEGVVLGTPWVYMALYDIDFDNEPEFFLGSLVRDGIDWVGYDSDCQSILGFSGSNNRPFLDGRLYVDSEGEEYYRTVEYIGNPTYPGAIISVIKNENGEWYITTSETYNEDEFETTDSYTEIHAFEVEIDRSDIKGSVEKCFEGYYGNSVQE